MSIAINYGQTTCTPSCAESKGDFAHGNQVRKKSVGQSREVDARAEEGNAEKRLLRQEGDEQETGNRDWIVRGKARRREGAGGEVVIEEVVIEEVVVEEIQLEEEVETNAVILSRRSRRKIRRACTRDEIGGEGRSKDPLIPAGAGGRKRTTHRIRRSFDRHPPRRLLVQVHREGAAPAAQDDRRSFVATDHG
jgi:hypothetical protein